MKYSHKSYQGSILASKTPIESNQNILIGFNREFLIDIQSDFIGFNRKTIEKINFFLPIEIQPLNQTALKCIPIM